MKSLVCLVDAIFDDVEVAVGASLLRDRKTVHDRVNDEGLSFLTITLPLFNDWLVASLEQRRASSSIFSTFRRQSGSSLPAFLQGLTTRIFDTCTGALLTDPDHGAIFWIRQLTLLLKKIKLDCTEQRKRAAFDRYVSLEKELRRNDYEYTVKPYFELYRAVSDLVWADIIAASRSNTELGISANEFEFTRAVYPSHSSGATADCRTGNSRYDIKQWYTRTDRSFPVDYWGVPNAEWISGIEFLEPDAELPVKVVTVPKTLKTPRIIAEEPSFVLTVQHGLRSWLYETIERAPIVGASVHFTDQTFNRNAALTSSITRNYSTLDLKDASDRVTVKHVKSMLQAYPQLQAAILNCRSRYAHVPGYDKLCLTKYASMGSALCFPIEAIVFYIIVQVALHKETSTTPCFASLRKFGKEILVYGDDIVVPRTMAQCVKVALTAFQLRVNESKSFSEGNFRESCGLDAYDGTDVTPVYCRCVPSLTHRNPVEFVTTVELANNLYKKGCWHAAQWLRDQINLHESEPLPVANENAGCLGFSSYLYQYEANRWNHDLQCLAVRGYSLRVTLPKSKATAKAALMKHFLKVGNAPYKDTHHLERYGRPVAFQLKRRCSVAR